MILEEETHWSTCNVANSVLLLHTGHVHVGACSCSCKNDEASKHWLWVQTMERHGTSIRNVDNGHFRDMTVEVATISVSCALLLTTWIRLSGCLPLSLVCLTFSDDLVLSDVPSCLESSYQVIHWDPLDKIDQNIKLLCLI